MELLYKSSSTVYITFKRFILCIYSYIHSFNQYLLKFGLLCAKHSSRDSGHRDEQNRQQPSPSYSLHCTGERQMINDMHVKCIFLLDAWVCPMMIIVQNKNKTEKSDRTCQALSQGGSNFKFNYQRSLH